MAEHGFGIIGCGMIAEFHVAAIEELTHAKLVAVYDRVEESAVMFSEKHAVEWCTDSQEFLSRDDIDIVCVCTPSGAHMDPAVAVAQAGKHVVVEKPVEVTLERIDKIINACNESGVQLCAIFQSRFSEAVQEVKKAVEENRFGRMTSVNCSNKWWRSQEYYDSGGWRGTWKLDGGGACMNQAIHAIDLIQWLAGDVDTVSAMTGTLCHERLEVEDTAAAVMKLKNGAIGVIEATTSVYPGAKRRIEIHGDKGTAVMEDNDITAWQFADECPEDEVIRSKYAPSSDFAQGASDPKAITHENHRRQLQNLVDSLNGEAELFVDGREGRNAVELILSIYESAKTGQPVKLSSKNK